MGETPLKMTVKLSTTESLRQAQFSLKTVGCTLLLLAPTKADRNALSFTMWHWRISQSVAGSQKVYLAGIF